MGDCFLSENIISSSRLTLLESNRRYFVQRKAINSSLEVFWICDIYFSCNLRLISRFCVKWQILKPLIGCLSHPFL